MRPALRQSDRNSKSFQFYFSKLDTLVLVERSTHGVLIRATRDTFSERRKVSFIRELGAEGFIDDSYHTFLGFEGTPLPICWCIDYSWLEWEAVAVRRRTNRFMVGLIGPGILLWMVVMGTLLLQAG